MLPKPAAAVLTAMLISASTATAETLWVHSDTPASVVAPDGTVVGTCHGHCTYVVDPGPHLIVVDETPEAPEKRRTIDVRGPTEIDVRGGSSSTRSTGLVLAIVGTVAVPVGLVGVVANTHTCFWDCRYDHETSDRSAQTAWAFVALGGAAMSATGWILWGTSNTKVRVVREARLAIVPTRQGAFGGVSIAF